MQTKRTEDRVPQVEVADSEWEAIMRAKRLATAQRRSMRTAAMSCRGIAQCSDPGEELHSTPPEPAQLRHRFHEMLGAVSRSDPSGHLGDLLSLGSITSSEQHQVSLRERFDALTDEWIGATRLSSSVTETSMHPAYQRIIGLGPDVLPFILEDVESGELHWGWALQALTGHDAAAHAATLHEARHAWIRWGRSHSIPS